MAGGAHFRKWNGKGIVVSVGQNMAKAIGKFGLIAEGHSKKELAKGHGVLTGTLRRSIHTARYGYIWKDDNVEPSSGTPEQGGKLVEGTNVGNRITLMLGSGLVYAMAIHQGWAKGYKKMKGSFAGYHYLTNGVEKAKAEMPGILKAHQLK